MASVLAQTSPPHEVIVCNDGSTDSLAEALAPYMDRITLLHQENRGVAAARNLGLREATGEFVVVCDADDVYLPTLLEEVTALATVRSDLDILCTDLLIELDGRVLRRARPDPATFITDDQRIGILRRNFIPGISAFRRELLLEEGGYDESLRCAEDWDSWIRLILSGAKAGLVHLPLVEVRVPPRQPDSSLTRVLNGQKSVLQKVVARQDLSEAERQAAELHLGAVTLSLNHAWAKEALHDGTPAEVRRRCLDIARNPDYEFGSRVKAAAAALAPRWAQSRARREGRTDHRMKRLGL